MPIAKRQNSGYNHSCLQGDINETTLSTEHLNCCFGSSLYQEKLFWFSGHHSCSNSKWQMIKYMKLLTGLAIQKFQFMMVSEHINCSRVPENSEYLTLCIETELKIQGAFIRSFGVSPFIMINVLVSKIKMLQ